MAVVMHLKGLGSARFVRRVLVHRPAPWLPAGDREVSGHATVLLLNGVPVHVVSQRLGHASPVVTTTVYADVLPGSQREAADLFARRIRVA